MVDNVVKPFDPSYDYTQDLEDRDIKTEDGRTFVFLNGLEKLAKSRGTKHAKVVNLIPLMVSHADGRAYPGGMMCTFEYKFVDGGVYHGSADATLKNCDGNFKLYLTAMAESRAKARALRNAFSIGMCSVEEKSNATLVDDEDEGPVDDAQLFLLNTLATRNNLGKGDILALLDIPRKVKKLEELTKAEGRELAIKLNRYRPKKKKG